MAWNVKLQRETSGTVFDLAPDDVRYDDPVVVCGSCGKKGIASDYLNLVVVIGSLGHHSLVHLKEQPGELWACSLDCWESMYTQVGQALITELTEINAACEQSQHTTAAKERQMGGAHAQ